MKTLSPQEKIASAQLDLVINFPVYGSIYLRLSVSEDKNIRGAKTDGTRIIYNPVYLATLTHEQIIGVFIHETLHVINKHPLRMAKNLDFKTQFTRFNYACDYEINPVIRRSKGMNLHKDWLYESKWDDALAEEIFYQLPESDPIMYSGSDLQPGEVLPWPGDKKDADGNPVKPTIAEIDAKEQQVEQWVRAAAFKAQGVGKLDSDAKGVIKAATVSAVDWVDELQLMCENVCKDDYTWVRPNTRYVQQGVYLPSMTGHKSVDMLFFVDVSGSLSDKQLSQIAKEIQTVVGRFNIRVIVVYWSTGCKGMEMFDAGDVLAPDFKLSHRGRGGTNFENCWQWIFDNEIEFDIDPKAIIFFSDLQCYRYPENEPDRPLLWAQVPSEGNSFQTSYLNHLPKYGTHVRVPIYQ